LTTGGAISESSAGSVTATDILNAIADTGIDLDNSLNDIVAIGTDHTNGTNIIDKN